MATIQILNPQSVWINRCGIVPDHLSACVSVDTPRDWFALIAARTAPKGVA